MSAPPTPETWDLDRLQPHPENPRQGDVGAVALSIRKHGQYRPLVVQASTGYVIAGSTTLRALHEEGYDAADVWVLDVDDEEAVRIMVADNRTSDLASYDDPALAALLVDLSAQTGPGLEGTGWTPDDLDRLIAEVAYAPPLDPSPQTPARPSTRASNGSEAVSGAETRAKVFEALLAAWVEESKHSRHHGDVDDEAAAWQARWEAAG